MAGVEFWGGGIFWVLTFHSRIVEPKTTGRLPTYHHISTVEAKKAVIGRPSVLPMTRSSALE